MVVCRYVFLVFMLALLYVGSWTRASGQSPPDSVIERKEHRLGVQLGVFKLMTNPSTTISMSKFSAGGMARGNIEYGNMYYGKQSFVAEWNVNLNWIGAFADELEAAKSLGLYEINNPKANNTIRLTQNSNVSAIQSFGASIGGKIFFAPPREHVVVFFLRGYAGLQIISRKDFSVVVTNSNPRVDTTVQVKGETSGILPFIGITPGIEIRSGCLGFSWEFWGFQSVLGREGFINATTLGIHYFF
jgi:hypothetical protein